MIIPDSVKTGVEDDFTPGVMGGSNTTNNCFSYDPYVIGLNPPPFVPSTSLPGSHLEPPDCTTFPGVCVNAILFMGRNVVNLEGVVVDYEFIEVDCSTGADVGIALYSNTIVVVEDPFVTGIMLITCVEQGGNCYRLDLTYDDGCDENPVTDSYFFKHGDCAEDTTTYVNDLIDDPNNRGLSIKVSVNPIRDATLKLDLTGELSGAAASEAFISIFDAAGHALASQPLSFDGRQVSVPFDAAPGIYFYSARIGGQTFTGKFVKL